MTIHLSTINPYNPNVSKEDGFILKSKAIVKTACGLQYNVYIGGFSMHWRHVTCKACKKCLKAYAKKQKTPMGIALRRLQATQSALYVLNYMKSIEKGNKNNA